MTIAEIRIKSIGGIPFDKILGWTADGQMTTISYEIGGRQRTISIESEAVEVEFRSNVSG